LRALRACADAFAYFTVIPIWGAPRTQAPDAYALSFLPVAGAVVGAIAGAAGYGVYALTHAGWSFAVAWALAIGLTGAIHVDGFLDTCDGLLVTATPQRRLEIMTDPRHGTFAVVGMAILTVFWLLALAPVAPQRLPLVLAWSGALARLAALPNAWVFPYARAGAMSASFVSRPSKIVFMLSFAAVEVLAWYVAPLATLIAPLAVLLSLAGGAWAARRLGGGLTGDVYGAGIVTLEVLALLAAGLVTAVR
jgi:adenosylcobinamide-GDP ribazoletransferase